MQMVFIQSLEDSQAVLETFGSREQNTPGLARSANIVEQAKANMSDLEI